MMSKVHNDIENLYVTGTVRMVQASGHRIFTPNIPTVGQVRLRYPIAPLHVEGNYIMKEMEALKDIALNPITYRHMLYEGTSKLATVAEDEEVNKPSVLFFACGAECVVKMMIIQFY